MPVLMVLERSRFRLLRVVYFFCQSRRAAVEGTNSSRGSNMDSDSDTHQWRVRVAVSVLGRLLALPFMAVTALPTTLSATPPSPPDESTRQDTDVGVPWVLTLRTQGSTSSRSNGSGRRRVVLPCLDELYQPSLPLPPRSTHPHPRHTALLFRALLEQSMQFLVNTLKSAIHAQVVTTTATPHLPGDSNVATAAGGGAVATAGGGGAATAGGSGSGRGIQPSEVQSTTTIIPSGGDGGGGSPPSSLMMLPTAMEALSRLAEVPPYASGNTYTHSYIRIHIYIHTYTYTHTYTHTYIHTYIHTHILTHSHSLLIYRIHPLTPLSRYDPSMPPTHPPISLQCVCCRQSISTTCSATRWIRAETATTKIVAAAVSAAAAAAIVLDGEA